MSSARRPAFTLIELLVVIAIIAILVAILIPAVQKVRAAAARTQCLNNLKNQGIALHSYHDAKKYLPPGYETRSSSTTPLPGWGWATFLLPFLDQGVLYEQLNVETTTFGPGTLVAAAAPFPTQATLAVFRCPADQLPLTNPKRNNHGSSSYRAVTGGASFPQWNEDQDMGGVMFQNSKINMEKIHDGTSNTIAIGECIYNEGVTPNRRAAIWVGMTGYDSSAAVSFGAQISDVMWWLDASSSIINGPAPQAFGSRHGIGTHFCFCDATVRFVREGADVANLQALAGRDDGKAAELPN